MDKITDNEHGTDHHYETEISYDEILSPPQIESLHQGRKTLDYINLGTLDTKDKIIEVSIPKGFENDLVCQTMIWYLGSIHLNKLSVHSIRKVADKTIAFFEFLVIKNVNSPLPFSIFNEYKFYLTKEFLFERKVSTQSDYFNFAIQALKIFADVQATKTEQIPYNLTDWHDHTIYIAKAGTLANNVNESADTRDCLSSLFSNCPYTDTELVTSLKAVASTLILFFDDIRNQLQSSINSSEETKYLLNNAFSKYSLKEPPFSSGVIYSEDRGIDVSPDQRELSKKLYHALTKCINKTDNLALLELWSLNLGKVTPITSDDLTLTWSTPPTLEEMKQLWRIVIGEGSSKISLVRTHEKKEDYDLSNV